MKKLVYFSVWLSFIVLGSIVARAEEEEMDTPAPQEVSLSATHFLPSTSILPSDSLLLGSTIGKSFFSRLELTSNLFLDLQSVFNIMAKLKLLGTDNFAIAPHVTYSSQTVRVQVVGSPGVGKSENVLDVAPGATVSYRISKIIVAHTGAVYNIRTPNVEKDLLYTKTSYFQGFTVNQEFGILIGGPTLSPGVSYDIVYQIFGVGATLHFPGFSVGGHFYPGVQEGKFIPVINAGFVADL